MDTDIVSEIVGMIQNFVSLYKVELTTLGLMIFALYWVYQQKIKMDKVEIE